ncbi:aconitate hydratase [Entomophthora muscae]|uniref:Aconitate hydratase n=1 Tax=Entomophthora muscae TaxID=34485 RepID=A0ACC2US26_9FUNG|nr:aconitate hydratase [Entomophthora muscae]
MLILRDGPGLEVPPTRQNTYLQLAPDRVAMQDASAQMAVLQFMLCGRDRTAVPTSIHCDHLIAAQNGAAEDLSSAKVTNKEILEFLESAARKYAMSFWKPGSGIIHQIVLENYASPGALMLGTDSHTPNAGGLGLLAIGVGGADAVDAMADLPWELQCPKVLGVKLTGKLQGWASPKDVILHIAGLLSVRGGTGHILEYFGPGVETLSCTGMATICNMGAEVGATTSVFPFTQAMGRYLEATGRGALAKVCGRIAPSYLSADPACHYDQVLEVDLGKLEPHINGPFTPDLATPLSKFAAAVRENKWAEQISVGLIGSCTNSSYQDMSRAASVAQQALDKDICLPSHTQFLITPGSEQIRATIVRDGQADTLAKLGGKVLANACGPCIGQWKRNDIPPGTPNSILSSFNRNFRARNDGSAATLNFLASPEIVTALSLAGRLTFNPATDLLPNTSGDNVRLDPPPACADLPSSGFTPGDVQYRPEPASPDASTLITVDPKSDRLQLLDPFSAWDGQEFKELRVLVKVQGKCTTDHISAAGKWLKYKGHLENLANNTLIGALSAGTGKVNCIMNHLTNELGSIPDTARHYQKNNVQWAIVTDFNYGEGSAREHAAMQPRYLGCRLIIARSFARIHETNLKKQGVLALTFTDPEDYHKLQEGDSITTIDLTQLAPGKPLRISISRPNETFELSLKHTLSPAQISWFKAGSALNASAQTSSV